MNFRFTKSLGQNFLCNENVISDILGLAEVGPKSRVLEIGPGIGALSEELVSRCGKYVAIEIDTRFQARLEECIGKKGGRVLFEDYLSFSAIGRSPFFAAFQRQAGPSML